MDVVRNKSESIRLCQGLMAAALFAFACSPAVFAQNLLKPGEGLVGAPPPLEVEVPKPKQENTTQLPEVNVEGKRDPLSDADKRLRDKQKKLPGLGTEEERKRDRLERLNAWYQSLAKSPNDLSPDAQKQLEKIFDENDANHTVPGVPTGTQRLNPADYRDPIAVQEKKK